jgi:hypothetical protein
MDFEAMKKEIEDNFKEASDATGALIRAMEKMRALEVDFSELDTEQRNVALGLGKDIDMRTAYLLRSLLVRYGNVLYI